MLIKHRSQNDLHTCGTQKTHRWFWENSYQNAVSDVCHMCAYNVPDVCTYLGVRTILKYNIRAFQRRVARLSTTKTRSRRSRQSAANFKQVDTFWKRPAAVQSVLRQLFETLWTYFAQNSNISSRFQKWGATASQVCRRLTFGADLITLEKAELTKWSVFLSTFLLFSNSIVLRHSCPIFKISILRICSYKKGQNPRFTSKIATMVPWKKN